ncbi:hypothetical protein quinque_014179 [Culex quinquefasciatus]
MIIFSFLSSSTGSPVPSESALLDHPGRLPEQSSPSQHHHQKISTVALHSTEALMAGFLKSTDLGPHGPHGYGGSHHPHHGHPHGPLPPGMPMTSLAPFGLPHGLDAVGFPQEQTYFRGPSLSYLKLKRNTGTATTKRDRTAADP